MYQADKLLKTFCKTVKRLSNLLKIYVERYLQHYYGEAEHHINVRPSENVSLTSLAGVKSP